MTLNFFGMVGWDMVDAGTYNCGIRFDLAILG